MRTGANPAELEQVLLPVIAKLGKQGFVEIFKDRDAVGFNIPPGVRSRIGSCGKREKVNADLVWQCLAAECFLEHEFAIFSDLGPALGCRHFGCMRH